MNRVLPSRPSSAKSFFFPPIGKWMAALLLPLLLAVAAAGQSFPEKGLWTAAAVDSMHRIMESKKHRPQSLANSLGPFSSYSNSNSALPASRQTSTVCSTVSGRNFLYQDSLLMWTNDPILTSDGHVLVSGQFANYGITPAPTGGYCMKTDFNGNVIWKKLYDSVNSYTPDYINYFRLLELENGNFMMAGRTDNRVSENDDLILTRIDAVGNIIWSKTYESRYWEGFNGSGDFFALRDLVEDTATGDIYFAGSLWGGMNVVTRINGSNGNITWSNGYDRSMGGTPFGLFVNQNNLTLFQLGNGYYNQSYVYTTGLSKATGDTLFVKAIEQTGDAYAPRLFSTQGAVRTNYGHYLLYGRTTGYWEYPVHTGTKDLHHAGIIELDANFNFVKAFGFKNRIKNNGYNTRISVTPEYTGVFTMLDVKSGYVGEAQVVMFNQQNIYHQRKRYHLNEGLPNEPVSLRLPSSNGFLNIKLMGDSSMLGSDGSRIDYYRFHSSDTASMCIGMKDSVTTTWNFNFQPTGYYLKPIQFNVFNESLPKTISVFDFETTTGPACQVVSYCDTLMMRSDLDTICPLGTIIITTGRNKECGSLVPLNYDTTWVNSITRLNDSSYALTFRAPGSGYIYGSLLGCTLKKDSVLITVVNTRFSLDLGPDRSLCPGNTIVLNARKGFTNYLWQDNSTDSVFLVDQPGTYFVKAVNACGTIYNDTVVVTSAPPIDFFVSADRAKCNADTVVLSAPGGFLSYEWSNNYQISSLSGQSVVVSPLVDTAYYVKAEKTPGCFAFDTVRITVYHSPPIDLGSDRSFCLGDSAVFDAGAGFSGYTWSDASTGRQLTVRTAGEYRVEAVTTEGCKSRDTVKILAVHPLPVVSLDRKSSICRGDTHLLDAGSFSSYAWSTGATSPTINVSDTGRYWVRVMDGNGCAGSDTTVINLLHEVPAGFLPPDTAICSYGSLVLQGAGGYDNYQWNTGSTAASITIDKPGNYTLTVTDANGCTGTGTIAVAAKQCLTGFYMPDAFTPDGNGLNDCLRPLLFGNVESYRFTVYNRWGEIVFDSKDPLKKWNGQVKGMEQRTTVFAWICRFKLAGEETEVKRGTVVLIR